MEHAGTIGPRLIGPGVSQPRRGVATYIGNCRQEVAWVFDILKRQIKNQYIDTFPPGPRAKIDIEYRRLLVKKGRGYPAQVAAGKRQGCLRHQKGKMRAVGKFAFSLFSLSFWKLAWEGGS